MTSGQYALSMFTHPRWLRLLIDWQKYGPGLKRSYNSNQRVLLINLDRPPVLLGFWPKIHANSRKYCNFCQLDPTCRNMFNRNRILGADPEMLFRGRYWIQLKKWQLERHHLAYCTNKTAEMGTVLSKKISKPPRKKCTHIPQQCTHPHKCTHRDFLTCVCFHDPFTDFCATRVRQTLWLDLQNDSKNWGRIWTVDSWQGRLVTLSSRRSVS